MNPGWLEKIDHRVLSTILLLSEWDEKTDKELVEALSGMSYSQFRNVLLEIERYEDSPVRKISDTWQLVSKIDFWGFIKSRFDDQILDDLERISQIALSDSDGSFELPPNERWCAAIY
jgi:hypothetical protein